MKSRLLLQSGEERRRASFRHLVFVLYILNIGHLFISGNIRIRSTRSKVHHRCCQLSSWIWTSYFLVQGMKTRSCFPPSPTFWDADRLGVTVVVIITGSGATISITISGRTTVSRIIVQKVNVSRATLALLVHYSEDRSSVLFYVVSVSVVQCDGSCIDWATSD